MRCMQEADASRVLFFEEERQVGGMTVLEAIVTRRSFRRFLQKPIPRESLVRMLDAARLAPSAANRQPLRYLAVESPDLVAAVFDEVKWAAYLGASGAPEPAERPAAFVLILLDQTIQPSLAAAANDAGAAAENLMLAAWSEGIGSCWLGSCDKAALAALFSLPAAWEIHSAVALGYPAHVCLAEELEDTVRYRMDEDQTFHVPKRKLWDIAEIR